LYPAIARYQLGIPETTVVHLYLGMSSRLGVKKSLLNSWALLGSFADEVSSDPASNRSVSKAQTLEALVSATP
jgi:hypothetical protein